MNELFLHPPVILMIFTVTGLYSRSANPFRNRFLTLSFSLQYCEDNMVSLCCSLNVSPNVVDRSPVVLHTSFSEFVNFCINCSPSLPRQFFVIETFYFSFNSYIVV